MAPKEPFKVHSLSKHIENTKKGLSAEAQYNRRPANRSATSIKKEPGSSHNPNNLFANNDEDEDDATSSSDSSDDEGTSDFLKKLVAPGAKASLPTPRRRSNKQEIADSDDERKASGNSARTAKKGAPAKAGSKHSGQSSSDDSDSEADGRTNGAKLTKASTTTSDTSSSGSDSESESEADKKVKTKAQTSESSSDDTSSSDSESESESEKEAKSKSLTNGKAPKPKAAASSSSESDSGSDSRSEDEEPAKPVTKSATTRPTTSPSSGSDEDSDEEMVDESMHISQRQNGRQLAAPNFIAPDFVLRKGEDGANGNDVAQICNQASLEGKQFWYFTVPSNVPISVVQNMEIPMNVAQRNGTVFSHDGEDYGVSFESIAPKGNIQILIPSSTGVQYQSTPRRIDQVMQVKRITQLGVPSTDAIGPAPKRPARPQPKGLKARYQPLGVTSSMGQMGPVDSDAEENEADTEMTEAPALPTTKSAKTPKEKKSKKSTAAEDAVSTPQTGRKGKRKQTASEEDAVAAAEQLKGEIEYAMSKPKKLKRDRGGSPDLGSEPASASSKKQTPVPPPTVPALTDAKSPSAQPATKKTKKTKEPKESRPVTPAPAPAPVPAPGATPRQTTVPIPSVPHSSPAKPPSTSKEEKRARKRKAKDDTKKVDATPSSHTVVPSPAGKKMTPVPPPRFNSLG